MMCVPVRRIAELAAEEGKAVVIVVNKWDTVEDKTAEAMKTAEQNIKDQLRQVSWAKCIFTSATQGAALLHPAGMAMTSRRAGLFVACHTTACTYICACLHRCLFREECAQGVEGLRACRGAAHEAGVHGDDEPGRWGCDHVEGAAVTTRRRLEASNILCNAGCDTSSDFHLLLQ